MKGGKILGKYPDDLSNEGPSTLVRGKLDMLSFCFMCLIFAQYICDLSFYNRTNYTHNSLGSCVSWNCIMGWCRHRQV